MAFSRRITQPTHPHPGPETLPPERVPGHAGVCFGTHAVVGGIDAPSAGARRRQGERDALRIRGGGELRGRVRIGGAKNAALPLMAATLLSEAESELRNVPGLRDVRTMAAMLAEIGRPARLAGDVLRVGAAPVPITPVAPYDLVRQMRASVLVLGPLLARYGEARISLPGGCAIGARPIGEHLRGLEALGAQISMQNGYVAAKARNSGLVGAEFAFAMPTVTGTENLMMAAVLAKGTTVLGNAAREPEIVDLSRALNGMGAEVRGAGTPTIRIRGVQELAAMHHSVMPDRIEAGTLLTAVGVAGGRIVLEGASLDTFRMLGPVIAKLREAGVSVRHEGERIIAERRGALRAVTVSTAPHPGFPTDMQAQFMAMMCCAEGRSVVNENVFENRFMHVPELRRMGARIETHSRNARVEGVKRLCGASVMASDLRASAALVVAGLAAEGETLVRRVYHLDRGYDRLEEKLTALGAHVARVRSSQSR